MTRQEIYVKTKEDLKNIDNPMPGPVPLAGQLWKRKERLFEGVHYHVSCKETVKAVEIYPSEIIMVVGSLFSEDSIYPWRMDVLVREALCYSWHKADKAWWHFFERVL